MNGRKEEVYLEEVSAGEIRIRRGLQSVRLVGAGVPRILTSYAAMVARGRTCAQVYLAGVVDGVLYEMATGDHRAAMSPAGAPGDAIV